MTLVIMTENGPIPEAFLDGYGFGDRQLEGVMFRITIVDNEITCPGVHASHDAYIVQFSREQRDKWHAAAVENCKALGDNLSDANGEDAWIEIAEADVKDPLAGVRESEDLALDYVDASAVLRAMGREPRELRTVRPIEAESFGDISKRIVGKLSPKETG